MKSVKLLILSHSSELSGGAERSMLDLMTYWRDKGYVSPHFIIRKPLAGLERELKKLNLPYTAIHYTNWAQRNPSKHTEVKFKSTIANAQAVMEIEKLIKELKPDIVATNTLIAPWAALAAYYQRVPHIWFVREFGTDHGHVFELGREKTLGDIGTLSNLVVANSKTLKNELSEFIDKDTLATLYNPFDISSLIKKSEQKGISNPFTQKNSLKIVIAGRVSESKGQHIAAEAVGKLSKKGYDVELAVVGVPSQEGDDHLLKEAIETYGIADRIHCLGFMDNPLAIVKYADIGVMSSRKEAFGRVTFEYMALSKPVIGSNSGATPELINEGHTGFLYNESDSTDLAENIEKYLEDRNLVRLHGEAAYKKASKMMTGVDSADAILERIKTNLPIWKKDVAQRSMLNFSRAWLDYGLLAEKYIEEQNAVSVKSLMKRRLKSRAKSMYLKLNLPGSWVKRVRK